MHREQNRMKRTAIKDNKIVNISMEWRPFMHWPCTNCGFEGGRRDGVAFFEDGDTKPIEDLCCSCADRSDVLVAKMAWKQCEKELQTRTSCSDEPGTQGNFALLGW